MPTFRPLDAEPSPAPPRRRWLFRRPVIVAGLVIVVAAAAVGGRAIDQAVAGGSSASDGDVLVWNSAAMLAFAHPDGTKQQPFDSLGFLGGGGAVVAPDGKALVTSAGDIVTLDDGRPVKHSTALYGPLSANGGGYMINPVAPFADGSADVLFAGAFDPDAAAPASKVMIASRDGTDVRDLGTGDSFAGDPLQAAAFVAVAADPAAQPPGAQERADVGVEHRVVGGTTTTLVTAKQLAKDLSLSGNPAFALGVVPDPTGKKLEVEVQDPSSEQDEGTLVLDRNGGLVYRSPDVQNDLASWSPSGASMLFTSKQGIDIWTSPGTLQHIAFPAGVGALNYCAWSPDEQQIACAGYPSGGGPVAAWIVVNRKTLSAKGFPAAGLPLLWVG
ncbi:MAG: hypothetical protein ACRDV3_17310 [Acidothermaceae bacterium]